jgi:hypothetical protein
VRSSHATEVFDLLGCAESCEVFQGRLSKLAVCSSRQPVSRSLFRLLGDCAHIAATFVGPSETKIDARYLEKLVAKIKAGRPANLLHSTELPLEVFEVSVANFV